VTALPRAQAQAPVDLAKLKTYLINAVTRDLEANPVSVDHRGTAVDESLQRAYQQTRLNLAESLRAQVFHDVVDDLLGYGPIQPLLDDAAITEVMVNGANQVYVERNGKLVKTNVTFENDAHVLRIIERIVLPLGDALMRTAQPWMHACQMDRG
jgi:pilus assembly protein CpaF